MNAKAVPIQTKQLSRVRWTPGKVFAIETLNDVWILAQVVDEVHIAFFNSFATGRNFYDNDWDSAELLFVKGATNQFMRDSNVYSTDLKPKRVSVPSAWINIKIFPQYKKFVLWGGTPNERRLKVEYCGSLVDDNLDMLIDRIRVNDRRTIDTHETSGMAVAPYTNHRLYLCHKLGRNADPVKELAFRRTLPVEYKPVIDGLYPKDHF